MTWTETGQLSFSEFDILLELIEGAQQQPSQPPGAAARKARRQRLTNG